MLIEGNYHTVEKSTSLECSGAKASSYSSLLEEFPKYVLFPVVPGCFFLVALMVLLAPVLSLVVDHLRRCIMPSHVSASFLSSLGSR